MKPVSSVILMPCYNVINLCEELITFLAKRGDRLIIVDDGSTDGTTDFLQNIVAKYKNLHLVSIGINRGKGFALLAGMKYAIDHLSFDTLITMDGDNQHTPPMLDFIQKKLDTGSKFVIGGRNFALMPLKSRFANIFMSYLLKFFCKKAPHDTQSGLRGFKRSFVLYITKEIEGGRYEMEFACILLALEKHIEISEVQIPTVYLEKNKYTHFKILRDSGLVLKMFFKFYNRIRTISGKK
jgi:glycosyltransferase involved in cell wall biosynthesis